jgi:hypothetical protein
MAEPVTAGPQKYPGADLSAWYQDDYPGDRRDVDTAVWHSTEGTSLPGYGGGASAPNFTFVPDFKAKRLKVYQHYDADVSSRALRNLGGGVQTNTNRVVQVEIVGTCDPATHEKWKPAHLYMPELPDWAIRDLASFAEWLRDKHGVLATSDVTWRAYPSSYGASPVRLSGARWDNYRGHLGHQHVPENDHGDPGSFPMQAILRAVSDPAPKPPAAGPAPLPTVSLKHVVAAARRDPGGKQGATTYKAEVRLVEDALVKLGYLDKRWADGSFGTYTVAAYARLQRHLGYKGADADGRPGAHSLKWLGLRFNTFTKED